MSYIHLFFYSIFLLFIGYLAAAFYYENKIDRMKMKKPLHIQPIIQKIKSGKSFSRIANEMGVHRVTIKRMANMYGYKSKYKFGGNHK